MEIILFTKDPCPLCDDVKEMLDALQGTYPHNLVEVDITQDEELNGRYRFAIPVLKIRDNQLKAPITLFELTKFLREAA